MLANFLLAAALAGALPSPLEQIRKNFSNAQSFEVKFVQTVDQKTFSKQAPSAEGELKASRPNQMEWIYQKPRYRKISYDGKRLEIDDGSEKEVVNEGKLSLEESFSFLWGKVDSKNFRVENLSNEKFRIVPQNPQNARFQSLEVRVQKGFVSDVVVVDLLDSQSRFQFLEWKKK